MTNTVNSRERRETQQPEMNAENHNLRKLFRSDIPTFMRPVPSLRLANDAALCDSYSRKQKPRFFFLSSGEL